MADRSLSERLRSSQHKDQTASDPTPSAEELQQRLEDESGKVARKRRRGRLLAWFVGADELDESHSEAVTDVRPVDAKRWKEQDFYPVEAPYTFARILKDRITGELHYEAIEPRLSEHERRILEFVEDALVRGLNIDPGAMDAEERHAYLREAIKIILRDYRIALDEVGQRRIDYYVRRDFLGYGDINVLMTDPNIEDISCDGAYEDLFVFHRNYESIPTTIRFENDASLDGFVIRLAQRSGKAISISEPMLDAALSDGSRLQATLGREVTQNGSTFTIRRFRPEPFTPLDLVEFGTVDVKVLAWFWLMVEQGRSLILAGGTASGKTTALNAIGQFIPPQAKVVTIEDTREVNLPHKNWIKAVTRSGSLTEGAGEIGMFQLLKAALRQRPEYILVGEVRGVEATVAFQAMATGHTVHSTMHADSARSVVYRLENDPINIPRLVLQALDIIAIQAQVRIKGKRVRRITEVVELVGLDPATKELLTNTVYRWDSGKDQFVFSGRSFMMERLADERSMSLAELQEEFARRQRVISWMLDERIPSVQGLTDIVKAYYLDPDAVMVRIDVADGSAEKPQRRGGAQTSAADLAAALAHAGKPERSGERGVAGNVSAEGPGAAKFLAALQEDADREPVESPVRRDEGTDIEGLDRPTREPTKVTDDLAGLLGEEE